MEPQCHLWDKPCPWGDAVQAEWCWGSPALPRHHEDGVSDPSSPMVWVTPWSGGTEQDATRWTGRYGVLALTPGGVRSS